jgi:hypothetical protein
MRNLANTVGDEDAFRPIMACHYSDDGTEKPCLGYVAVHGWSNLSVRLMVAYKKLDIRAVEESCATIELWPSFGEMLAAYEEAIEQKE